MKPVPLPYIEQIRLSKVAPLTSGRPGAALLWIHRGYNTKVPAGRGGRRACAQQVASLLLGEPACRRHVPPRGRRPAGCAPPTEQVRLPAKEPEQQDTEIRPHSSSTQGATLPPFPSVAALRCLHLATSAETTSQQAGSVRLAQHGEHLCEPKSKTRHETHGTSERLKASLSA